MQCGRDSTGRLHQLEPHGWLAAALGGGPPPPRCRLGFARWVEAQRGSDGGPLHPPAAPRGPPIPAAARPSRCRCLIQ
eukprot:scaffold22080_cov125-Isochrysis_galbana.AAC.2